MANVIDGGLTFAGYLQPPDVPADPTGNAWRGLTGATGATGDASLVSVLATGSTTARSAADRAAAGYDIRDFGAMQDGTTDDDAAINATVVAATAAGKPVFIFNTGHNIIIGSPVVLIKNACILGFGRPVLFLKAAANCAVLQSSGFQANIGPATFTDGDANIVLDGLVIDGNRANQTASGTPNFQNGISIYGTFPTITNCIVRNAYGHGIRIGGQIAGAATSGFEPIVTNVHVDNSGRHGIWYQGPSDGHFSSVISVDAGQAADNTYFGLLVETTGRFFNFHGWHTSTATNRVAYQAKFTAGGEIVASHFEGGRKQLCLSGGSSRVVGCSIYANFGASGNALIDVLSNSNQVVGCSITNAGGINDVYGVNFGNSASGNFLTANYYTQLKVYGPFNFSSDGGLNVINDRGFMAAGGATAFGGTPLSSNEINYYQGGSVIDVNTVRRIDAAVIGAVTPAGGSFTTISGTSSATLGTNGGVGSAVINGPAGSSRLIRFQTAGLSRWAMFAEGSAEGGANAGTNWQINCYDDTGALLYTPVSIIRSTGMVGLAKGAVISGGLSTIDAAVIGATTPAAGRFTTLSASGTLSGAAATFTGNVTLGTNAAVNAFIVYNGAAGFARGGNFQTAGLSRWWWGASPAAEGGSNAGSDFFIDRYSDAGTYLSNALTITRSTGTLSAPSGITNTPISGSTGSFTTFGANSATPSAKITITGSRGGATATVLASLLTAMAAFGLITDSTTA